MNHRVGELHVHVRAPPGMETGLRSAAEGFSRSVLERMAERLDAEAPDRLVFIRELFLRWRLGDRQLEDGATAEQCAGEIVECVRDAVPLGLEISATDAADDLAIFSDESHWRAAYLLARARGAHSRAWFFKALEQEWDSLETLVSPARLELAWAVLERLAMAGYLIEVVSAAPRQRWTALAERLVEGESLGPLPTDLGSWDGQPSSPPESLIHIAHSLPPDLPYIVAALVLHVHARVLPGTGSREITPLVQHCLALREKNRKGSETAGTDPVGATDARRQPEHADSELATPVMKSADQKVAQKEEGAEESITQLRLGGLFYLLNCALELNLGETLWKACLPEQKILAHAVAALVGEDLEDDPSISLFAGSGPDPPIPSVSEDQLNEVSEALLIELCTALPRRGLAQWPQTMLSLERQGSEPLLVARPLASPFIIFARPAPSPEAARTALETFLTGWTRSAPPPLAPPGLAELDASGRLRPLQHAETPTVALLPKAEAASVTALLAQTIGVLCCLLQARSGTSDAPSVDAFVAKFMQLPARVRVTAEALTVAMPAEAIKVELRRAGLDRDPGWVPWLRKVVRFEFTVQDEHFFGLDLSGKRKGSAL